MANARIKAPGGIEVTVEGTPEEVARVLALVASAPGRPAPGTVVARQPKSRETAARHKDTTPGRILRMRDDGFFDSEQTLGDVQKELRRRGHLYPVTSLSPAMLDLTRRQDLRRLKSKSGRWTYVKP